MTPFVVPAQPLQGPPSVYCLCLHEAPEPLQQEWLELMIRVCPCNLCMHLRLSMFLNN